MQNKEVSNSGRDKNLCKHRTTGLRGHLKSAFDELVGALVTAFMPESALFSRADVPPFMVNFFPVASSGFIRAHSVYQFVYMRIF
jgi:hypothetical protein